MFRANLEHNLKTHGKTITMNIDIHEMNQGKIFMTIVDLGMYHDTVLLVVSSRVPAFSVSAVARVLPCVSCLCW